MTRLQNPKAMAPAPAAAITPAESDELDRLVDQEMPKPEVPEAPAAPPLKEAPMQVAAAAPGICPACTEANGGIIPVAARPTKDGLHTCQCRTKLTAKGAAASATVKAEAAKAKDAAKAGK